MKRSQLVGGLVLIAVGAILLLMQFVQNVPGVFLTALGLVFLVAYILTRTYGLLIPGCIIAGLGIGMFFGAEVLGLGIGFVAIFAIQFVVARGTHWWPLIPGGVLVLIGLAQALPNGRDLIEKGWPLILIVIGVAVLARSFIFGATPNPKA